MESGFWLSGGPGYDPIEIVPVSDQTRAKRSVKFFSPGWIIVESTPMEDFRRMQASLTDSPMGREPRMYLSTPATRALWRSFQSGKAMGSP
jgi:hypothetical protein